MINFIIAILVVGVVTGGLKIKFDRFFTIFFLFFIFGCSIFKSVDIFLWIIVLGAAMIILNQHETLSKLPKEKKIKLFIFVPFLTLVSSFIGSLIFVHISATGLTIILGLLALLFGLRLTFIHITKEELNSKNPAVKVQKFCGLFGPLFSGLFIGLIGTSLKSLKIPFGIKVGKMNSKSIYIGNAISTFFASIFAIIFHYVLSSESNIETFYSQMLLGAGLWTGLHYVSEITDFSFKDSWRKGFKIIIGVLLTLVSIKVFLSI